MAGGTCGSGGKCCIGAGCFFASASVACGADTCCVGSDCLPNASCGGSSCCVGSGCDGDGECTGADCCTGSGCGGGSGSGSGSGGSGGSGGGSACYGPGCGPGGTCTNGEAKIVVSGPTGSYPCCGDGCFIVACSPIYVVADEVKASCSGCPDYAPYQKEIMGGWIECSKCPEGSEEVTNYTSSGEEKGCCPVYADKTELGGGTFSGYTVVGAVNGACCGGYTVEDSRSFYNGQQYGGIYTTISYSIAYNNGYYCQKSLTGKDYGSGSTVSDIITEGYPSVDKFCRTERMPSDPYGDTYCRCSSSGDPRSGTICDP